MSIQDRQTPGHDGFQFDRFEVRIHSGMLFCDEQRIRIQDLPFRLLVELLETPRQVVSSDELAKRLGAPNSPLELGSLRVAATKLREALGDSATAPRFIKTVSGQGYKFVANVVPVMRADPADDPRPEDSPEFSETIVPLDAGGGPNRELNRQLNRELDRELGSGPNGERHGEVLSAGTALERAIAARRQPAMNRLLLSRTRKLLLGIFLLTILLASSVGLYFYWSEHHLIADSHDMIVLGGFVNTTDSHDLDGTLSSAFQVKIQESPYLKLARIQDSPDIAARAGAATLIERLEGCRALHGQILLEGELATHSRAAQVVLTARACADGKELGTQKVEAESTSAVLPALDLAADRMRRRLGEPQDTLQKFNVPLNQATTDSLAALRAFTRGEEKRSEGLEPDSIRDYKLAADLDPQFALAYARMGAIYFNASEYVLSRENFQKAFELRGRTTDRERLYITANYYAFITGETKRAIEAYELWSQIYPNDIAPVNNLAILYLLIGEPARAVELAKSATRMDSNTNLQYATWPQAYLQIGDYRSLNALCNNPQGRGDNSAVFHVTCFQGAFAQGDEAGMLHHLRWADGKTEKGLLLQEAGMVALYRGKATESWRFFAQAKESGLQNGLDEFAVGTTINEGTFKADVGLGNEAIEDVLHALMLAPGGAMTQGSAALALARAGDLVDAEKESDKSAAQSPLDTILNAAVLATTHAAIDLQRHDPQSALRSLEQTRAYDWNEFMFLAPAYYRGLAYLENKQPDLAAKEFERLLDHRVIAPDSPYVALSQLQLGRALQLSGDRERAREAFKTTESLWRQADADFLPLRQLHTYERQFSSVTSIRRP